MAELYGVRIREAGYLSLDDGDGTFTTQGMDCARIEKEHKVAAKFYTLAEAEARVEYLFDWIFNERFEQRAEVQICYRPSWRAYRRIKRVSPASAQPSEATNE